MKFFAVATILAAAVSAAPAKNSCPSPIVSIPSYGLPSPPLNGVIPPVNGEIPPVNVATPTVNVVVPPVNVATPPVNIVVPPINVATPPVNIVIPPVIGGSGPGQFECPGELYSNPQCCSVSVLGLADLDCRTPTKTPKDGADFQAICTAQGGKKAQCCVLPIAGQSLLCQDVIGAY